MRVVRFGSDERLASLAAGIARRQYIEPTPDPVGGGGARCGGEKLSILTRRVADLSNVLEGDGERQMKDRLVGREGDRLVKFGDRVTLVASPVEGEREV